MEKSKAILIAFSLFVLGAFFAEFALEEGGMIPRTLMIHGETGFGRSLVPGGFGYVCFIVAIAVLVAGFSCPRVKDLAFGRDLCWGAIVVGLLGGVIAFGYGALFVPAGSNAAWTGVIGGIFAMFIGALLLFLDQYFERKMREKTWGRYI